MGARRPWAVIAAAALLASMLVGCAHDVRIESEPPGARVLVDDEPTCMTPCTIEERSSGSDITRVEVQSEEAGEAVRFDLLRERWTYGPVAAGVALGAVALALSGAAAVTAAASYTATSLFLVAGGAIIAPTVGAAGLGLLLVGTGFGTAFAAYALSITLATLGTRLPLAMAGEASRISDEEVFVDFDEDEVYASPGDNVRRLIGAQAGYKPMPWPAAPPDEEALGGAADKGGAAPFVGATDEGEGQDKGEDEGEHE
jgi:hypothetical protein